MLTRAVAEVAFHAAVAACDPAVRVAAALRDVRGPRIGLAIGKAALAMARGAGEVVRGLAVTSADDGRPLPQGWHRAVGSHPLPDARSLAAARAAINLVDTAGADDQLIALISGGASALVEWPRVPLDQLRRVLGIVMAAGVPIDELNAVRGALSTIKSGRLALRSRAPIVTLATSDVIGDALAVIGSGPTIGPWLDGGDGELGTAHEAQRVRALAIARRCGVAQDDLAALATPIGPRRVVRDDRAWVIAPIAGFARAAAEALVARGVACTLDPDPLRGPTDEVATRLIGADAGILVAWGESTVVLPAAPGEGGRAQQLALALARRLRGGSRAALVVGSDGVDGPAPAGRPAPAGAFVDGATWDAIAAAGLDPEAALARADAGPALARIGALVVTGPTGINHADLVLIG